MFSPIHEHRCLQVVSRVSTQIPSPTRGKKTINCSAIKNSKLRIYLHIALEAVAECGVDNGLVIVVIRTQFRGFLAVHVHGGVGSGLPRDFHLRVLEYVGFVVVSAPWRRRHQLFLLPHDKIGEREAIRCEL
jgi:hypothetical protein